jgi:hypothetical protein
MGASLQNNVIYYYVVTTFELGSSAGESEYSVPTAAKTGEWTLDFGDGLDPNAFGGTNSAGASYEKTFLPGGASGYARKFALSSSAAASLNSVNLTDATKLLMWVKGGLGNETFSIGLKDASNNTASVSFSNPSTDWTLITVQMEELKQKGLTLSDLSQLIVSSTGPATIYLYDIRFKTNEAPDNVLKIHAINASDQTVSTGIHFTGIDLTQPDQYKLSDQVIKVEYNPPQANDVYWKIRIYTDNNDYDRDALPYQRNGLLNQNKKCTIPVKWMVYDDIQSVQFTSQNANQWSYLKDKNDLDIPGTSYDESWAAANKKDEEYTVIAFGSNNQTESWSRLGKEGTPQCAAPIYVYMGGVFKGAMGDTTFVAARGEYSTIIYLELYNE